MRAVIYCRVSTTEQAQNLSLPTQDKACREYCARQGYDVDAVFVDAGESAKTTDRPEFLRLLEHCRHGRGRLHAVVVYSLTRFSRNSADHHAIAGLLRGLGITLRSVTEPIDDSPSGRLMEGILAAMAQFDNDVRSERVVAGMKAAVDRGRWVWVAPLGYRNMPLRAGGPSLMPDPERAPLVTQAFECCARGIVGRELLAHLSAIGLRTKRGDKLSLSRLYQLLRQPAYAGIIHPKGWAAPQPGDYAPLVSPDVFARVQAQLTTGAHATKARRVHVDHPDFPLRRFVRCGQCGRALSGSWTSARGKRYAFYHCSSGCSRVRKATIEAAFVEALNAMRPRREFWMLLRVALVDVAKARRQGAGDRLASARRRVSELEAKLARVDEAFLFRETIDEMTYRTQRDKLREDLTIARLQLTDATTEDIDLDSLVAATEHAIEHAGTLWFDSTDLPRRLSLQWAVFPAGLRWRNGAFETPVTCFEFYELRPKTDAENGLVDHLGPTWQQISTFLQSFAPLKVGELYT